MGQMQNWLFSLVLVSGVLSSAVTIAADLSDLPVDRFIIKFKDSAKSQAALRASPAAFQRLQQAKGVQAQPVRRMANGAMVVRMSESRRAHQWLDVMTELSHDAGIAYIEPDLRMIPAADPYYNQQWYLYAGNTGINAPSAWGYSTGQGAVIAILDSGIRPHADLAPNTLSGYDFISDVFTANDGNGRDADAQDPGDGIVAGACGGGIPDEDQHSSWHGTHVAGTVAAVADNGIGIVGIAHEAKLLPLRVLGRCGGYSSDIADAIYWAAGYTVPGVPANSTPADVINLSLSSSSVASCGQAYTDAISAAIAADVTVVAAAGNSSANANDYSPANCAGVIAVAATDHYGSKAPYSNSGSVVDLVAPGGTLVSLFDDNGIWSTFNTGEFSPGSDTYQPYQGTSMAAPQVSATVALMKSVVPTATASEIEQAIKDTTQNIIGACAGCGTGLLDVEESVKRILGLTVAEAVSDLSVALKGNNGKFIKDTDGSGEGTIHYIVEITNNGPDQASDLVASHVFPADVTLELLSSSVGALCDLIDYRCFFDELESGASVTFNVRVRTSNSDKMNFSAGIASADADPNTDNNFVTARFGGSFGVLSMLCLGLLLARFKWY
jgi:serine protease